LTLLKMGKRYEERTRCVRCAPPKRGPMLLTIEAASAANTAKYKRDLARRTARARDEQGKDLDSR